MNAAKDTIRGRLHIDPPAPGEPAASYMHFPADRDLNYFSQLLAERSVLKVSGGQRYRVWEQLRAGQTKRWTAGCTAMQPCVACFISV